MAPLGPIWGLFGPKFIPREKVTVKKAIVKSCTLLNFNPQGAPRGPPGDPLGAPGSPWGPLGAPGAPLGPPGGPWGLEFGKVQDLTAAFLTVTFSRGVNDGGIRTLGGGPYIGPLNANGHLIIPERDRP